VIFSFFWSKILAIYLSFLQLSYIDGVRLCVRDDKYGWAVVEKSTNHCVVRWVLNSLIFIDYRIK